METRASPPARRRKILKRVQHGGKHDYTEYFFELKRIAEEYKSNDSASDPKRLLNYFETNRNRLRISGLVKKRWSYSSSVGNEINDLRGRFRFVPQKVPLC
jgi:hypothetical protein